MPVPLAQTHAFLVAVPRPFELQPDCANVRAEVGPVLSRCCPLTDRCSAATRQVSSTRAVDSRLSSVRASYTPGDWRLSRKVNPKRHVAVGPHDPAGRGCNGAFCVYAKEPQYARRPQTGQASARVSRRPGVALTAAWDSSPSSQRNTPYPSRAVLRTPSSTSSHAAQGRALRW
jgi:hypothetical protein